MANVKRLLIVLVLAACAFALRADYLYFTVSPYDPSGWKFFDYALIGVVDSESGEQVTDSSGEGVYLNLIDTETGETVGPVLESNDRRDYAGPAWADLGEYASSDYSFFVETWIEGGEEALWRLDNQTPVAFDTLVKNGAVYTGGTSLEKMTPWEAIPEPTSGLLLLLGLAGLALRRRRLKCLLVVSFVAVGALNAGAVSVSYRYPVYNTADTPTSGIKEWKTATASATAVASSTSNVIWGGTSGTEYWYVVNSTVTISKGITCTGKINLILADGCKLTATPGIYVTGNGNSLTIYGQANDTGELSATSPSTYTRAAIGGFNSNPGSNITINGGKVTARSKADGVAGIGGGKTSSGYNITINGGTVDAMGGVWGAGIGGGNGCAGTDITINGGTVIACGNTYSAAIGGGMNGAGMRITINDGMVTATGGPGAAGIGGSGNSGSGSDIAINGGTVIATGGSYAAAIGGGYIGTGSNISLAGGTVIVSKSGRSDFIGSGDSGGNVSGLTLAAETKLFFNITGVDQTLPTRVERSTIMTGETQADDEDILSGLDTANVTALNAQTWTLTNSVTGATSDITVNGEMVYFANRYLALATDAASGKLILNSIATVSFTPTAVGNASYSVYLGENEFSGSAPYQLPTNATNAAVVYEANDGYVFSDGTTAKTNSVDCSVDPASATAASAPILIVKYLAPVYKGTDNNPANGIDHWVTNSTASYTAVSASSSDVTWGGTTGVAYWYVVKAGSAISLSKGVTCKGDIHLILTDGCRLTVGQGLIVPKTSTLTIYGQTENTGKLTATGQGTYAISGEKMTIRATAGIGGGNTAAKADAGKITINGGVINAQGRVFDVTVLPHSAGTAGIGGGLLWGDAAVSNSRVGSCAGVTINGGTVTACGGVGAAGIGGASGMKTDYGTSTSGTATDIVINGGTVKATSYHTNNHDVDYGGAGIGGGRYCTATNIVINAGRVAAAGGTASACVVGSGSDATDESASVYVAPEASLNFSLLIDQVFVPKVPINESGCAIMTPATQDVDRVLVDGLSGAWASAANYALTNAATGASGAFAVNGPMTYFASRCLSLTNDVAAGQLFLKSVLAVAFTPASVANTTPRVYLGDVEIAGPAPYMLPTNATDAVIVYKANDGYVFTDGSSVKTNDISCTADPATAAAVSGPVQVTDASYRYAVYNTDGTPASGIREWQTGTNRAMVVAASSSAVTWGGVSGTEYWYAVKSSVTISERITCTGKINLILCDGCTLTASKGITVMGSDSLKIYGQDADTGTLTAYGCVSTEEEMPGTNSNPAIGGYNGLDGGNVEIHSGIVNAFAGGGTSAAGIGGSRSVFTGASGSDITINGGTVTATGGSSGGAGIGGSDGGGGDDIVINGGTVTATGGSSGGAGIGGGQDGDCSDVTINGGTVTATGGSSGGAGIGGGVNCMEVSSITIRGGTVTASGGDSSADGIGMGENGMVRLGGGKFYVSSDLIVKAGATTPPTTIVAHDGVDLSLDDDFCQPYVTISPTVFFTPAAVAHTTIRVYAGEVELDGSAPYQVESNATDAVVVYTAQEGYSFADGATAMTNAIDCTTDPATAAAPAVPTDNSYRYAVYKTDGTPASGIREWRTGTNGVTVVAASSSAVTWGGVSGTEYWYAVKSSVTISERITCTGKINLILCDGCTLTASKGITVMGSDSLKIYGQNAGTGRLVATGMREASEDEFGMLIFDSYDSPAIGGYHGDGGNLEIHGGIVEVSAGEAASAAGLGGGAYLMGGFSSSGYVGSDITINGGTVTATGGSSGGAGIGGGEASAGRDIVINGGTVTVTGGDCAAGIGGGNMSEVKSSNIIINGGNITASGGSASADGIGAGTCLILGGIGTSNVRVSTDLIVKAGATTPPTTLIAHDNSDLTDNENFFQQYVTIEPKVFVSFTPTSVDKTTNRVYAGGVELDGSAPYQVESNATDAVVVYTAQEGYSFADGATAMTNAIDCTTDPATAAAPAVPTDNSYRYAVYKTDGTPASGIREWRTGTNGVTVVAASSSAVTWGGTPGTEYWYAVKSSVTISERITCTGKINLILCDGCTLTASKGITVMGSDSLKIYGQNAGTGRLVATGMRDTDEDESGLLSFDSYDSPAIGGYHGDGGNLEIHGGIVEASAGEAASAAGLGGGAYLMGGFSSSGYVGSDITINGGTVTATGGENAAGIGGGEASVGRDIVINGGTVTATGGAGGGAGIGGGYMLFCEDTVCNIIINGGNITASGGYVSADGIGAGVSHIFVYEKTSNVRVSTDLIIKAGEVTPPTTVVAHDNSDLTGNGNFFLQYVVIEPAPKVTFTPTALAHTTNRVYVGGVELDGSAPYQIVSNVTDAVIVYTADEGYSFDNGATATTNAIDCTTDPATAELPEEPSPLPVEYLEPVYVTADVPADGIAYWTTNRVSEYTFVTSAANRVTWGASGATNWYVVTNGAFEIGGGVECLGHVRLLLCPGAKLTVTSEGVNSAGIATDYSGSFVVYGQPWGGGELDTTGGSYSGAGISSGGSGICINGGTVRATGGWDGAGIGGAGSGSGVVINGGTVTAAGGGAGAGIGGGYRGSGSGIVINGGDVTALGNLWSAGIGGGREGGASDIVINGGIVRVANSGASDLIGNGSGSTASAHGVRISDAAKVFFNLVDSDTAMPAAFDGLTVMTPEVPATRVLVRGITNWTAATTFAITNAATTETAEIDVNGKIVSYSGQSVSVTCGDGELKFALRDPFAYLEPVYVTADDPADGIAYWATNYVSEYFIVTSAANRVTWGASGATSWYVVTNGAFEIGGGVECLGHVRLLLCPGAKLTTSGGAVGAAGIYSDEDGSFAVYGTPDGAGELTATGGDWAAGIGGDSACGLEYQLEKLDGRNITINAGTVTATGGSYAAGLGGGYYGSGSDIVINGGTVRVTGGDGADPIGNGYRGTGTASGNVIADGANVFFNLAGSGTAMPTNVDGFVVMTTATPTDRVLVRGIADWTAATVFTVTNAATAATTNLVVNGDGLWFAEKWLTLPHADAALKFSAADPTAIAAKPTALEHATPRVYTNGVASTEIAGADGEWHAWSNKTATVVYTADEGWCFAGGATASTNELDTMRDPATNTSAPAELIRLPAYLEPVYVTAGVPSSGLSHWTTNYVPYGYSVVSSSGSSVTWGSGWHVVESGTYSISAGVTCSGQVRLLLCPGAKLTVTAGNFDAGIRTDEKGSFTVYGTPDGAGELTAKGGNCAAGIGGYYYIMSASIGPVPTSGLNITINGGTVTATGGGDAAGIGGARSTAGRNIVINAGTVTATGGDSGAGIGGGYGGSCSGVVINGGTVRVAGGGSADPIGKGEGNYGSASGNVIAEGASVFFNLAGSGTAMSAAFDGFTVMTPEVPATRVLVRGIANWTAATTFSVVNAATAETFELNVNGEGYWIGERRLKITCGDGVLTFKVDRISENPIVEDVDGNDVTIVVPSAWRTTWGITDEQVSDVTLALGNGLPAWQSFALGIDPTNALARPYADAPQNDSSQKISVTFEGLDRAAMASGFDIRCRLERDEVAVGSVGPAAEIDITGEDPTGHYRLLVDLSSNGVWLAESVEAINTVGIVKAQTGLELTIVAVPWNRLAPGEDLEIAVSNLLKTATLAEGDRLHVLDPVNRTYDTWTLGADKTWGSVVTYKIGSDGKVSTDISSDPARTTIARGCGVWLERDEAHKDEPYYLCGQVSAAAPDLTLAKGHNLLGAPGVESYDFAHITGATADDQIQVPTTNGVPRVYTFKDGAWGRYKTTTTVKTIKIGKKTYETKTTKSEWVTDDASVPAGTGFWLINSGGQLKSE